MKKQFQHQSRKKVLSVAIGLAVAAVASPWSYAQTAAKGDAGADLNKLETVVVSAQRRDEEMQKVPISITTINVKDIEQKQIRRLDDIKFEVPNIVVEPNTGTSSGAKVFMRGVGTDESLFSADPSVAIYIDDVYIPRQTGALFDLFDVQRIEVLRGPQGTLYGRNATGGAIRYVTAKPNGQEKFEIDGRIGNLARQDIRAGLSTKLGENVDATFAVMSKNRDGYLKDITNGGKVNDEQVYGARASFGMNFGASSRATLALDSVKQRSGPTYASGIIDPATALRVGRPVNNADGDLLTIQTDLPNGLNDLDQSGVSLVTSTSFDGMDWRNILAYRRMSNLLYIDVDGTAQTRFHLYQDQKQSQNSYESQLISTGTGPLQWTGGVFFFNEKNDQPTRQDILATGSTNTISQKTSAAAVYGQADYKFDAVWKATGGLRYSSETKDMSIVSIRTNGTQAFQLAKKETWTRADWKVGLDAQLNQDVLAYATAATGFKSGGFNGRAASVAAFTTLKPEIVTSYEIGMKTTIADGRVRFNLNYYLNDYKDLQLTAFDTNGLAVLTNAASATLKGVEVEATAQITSAWQLSGNLGTIDGKYKDYTAANAATFAGKPLKQAPKQQWGLGTSYRLRVGKDAIIFNASAKHVGDHYQNLAASELIKTSAYTLVDARVGYEANGGKWALALWGKNLSDKQYYTGGFDIAGIGIASAYINVPRTYGVDFRYRFY